MKRCMFVDDSSVIRKVAKRILNGPDMLVIEAESGHVALDMCANDMPDIIVVDGSLTDMSVEEFIRNVRSAILPPSLSFALRSALRFDLKPRRWFRWKRARPIS